MLGALALMVVAGAVFVLWPKQYAVGQHIAQTTVFWNDREAFVFLAENTTGRSQNIFQQKLAATRYGYLTVLLGGYSDFSRQEMVAYHVLASGQMDRFALPERTATYGTWRLSEGELQLVPPATGSGTGFRWDGAKFVVVSARPAASATPRPAAAPNANLTEDDPENDDDALDSGLLAKSERKAFKDSRLALQASRRICRRGIGGDASDQSCW